MAGKKILKQWFCVEKGTFCAFCVYYVTIIQASIMTVMLNCTTNVLKEKLKSCMNLTSTASVPGKDQGGLKVKGHIRAREWRQAQLRPAIGAIWDPCFHSTPTTDTQTHLQKLSMTEEDLKTLSRG